MAQMVSSDAFAAWLTAGCDAKKWGYIFGATGQDPKKMSGWYFTGQYTGADRTWAQKWQRESTRVFDCNGLIEGYYYDQTGVNINSRARTNYADWCGINGTGRIPDGRRVSGAAVFIYSSGAKAVTHVGFLERPVKADRPDGDWYVIEARGVRYGVVRTRLHARPWNRWGWMTKYVDYAEKNSPALTRLLRYKRPMLRGNDVYNAQARLTAKGFSVGDSGLDGVFGKDTREAVLAFQKTRALETDGIVGQKTWRALWE